MLIWLIFYGILQFPHHFLKKKKSNNFALGTQNTPYQRLH